MAIILGGIDSLKNLVDLLKKDGVTHLESLNDILKFKEFCKHKVKESEAIARQEHDIQILRQNAIIVAHVSEKKTDPTNKTRFRNFIELLVFRFQLFKLKRELNRLEKKTEKIISQKISQLAGSSLKSKHLFDSNHALIQGALGEQKALDELRKLPDTFYVINNFQLRLFKPIYNKKTKQRVFTIQADHIVLGTSGVFLIETKNWSKGTIKRAISFTPVDQVKRTNFALFCYLNPQTSGLFSLFFKAKKITVRSILLMTGQMTEERDPFVKVVNLSELNNYITNFSPVLTKEEVKQVLNKLLR